jgi:hypothetical protein
VRLLFTLYARLTFMMSLSPSNEWQDRVVNMLNCLPSTQPQPPHNYNSPKSEGSEGNISHTSRRQRRRLGTEDHTFRAPLQASKAEFATPPHESRSGTTSWYKSPSPAWGDVGHGSGTFPVSVSAGTTDRRSSSIDSKALTSDSEEELLSAVGQLSMNEDEQIRFHGEASGIYLLGKKERLDQRNEGGIWLVFVFFQYSMPNFLCAGDFRRHASGPPCLLHRFPRMTPIWGLSYLL